MEKLRLQTFGRLTLERDWTPSDMVSLCKLYRVYGGSAYFRGMPLKPGGIYLLPAGKFEDWKLGESFDHLYFDFFAVPPLMLHEPIELIADEHPELDTVCTAVSFVLTALPKSEAFEIAEGFLTAMLGLVKRAAPLKQIRDPRIADTVAYICDNYREPELDLETLAARVHLEKCWFLKLFRTEVGQTPWQFVRELRLTHAAALLVGGKSVSEVAEAVGFASSAAFSTAFKRRFGVNPSKTADG